MKKYISLFAISLIVFACKKSELVQINPNEPTADGSLKSESGIVSFSAGILGRTIFDVPNAGASNIFHVALTNHSILGDEVFLPYGNFGFRWVDQVYQITLPDGTKVTNPFGVPHQTSLQSFNSRAAGDRNAFMYEWTICYFFIQQSNTILKYLDEGVNFSGQSASKKATLYAWAYWWKALAYSRIGSMYLAGIKTNSIGGSTNNIYLPHEKIIEEANIQFDNCTAALKNIDGNSSDYSDLMKKIILSFNDNESLISPDMWKRAVNTYKARNLLVNTKVSEMTADSWNKIITLCNDGIKADDNYFKWGMTSDGNNDLSNSWMHPYSFLGPTVQWTFLSERFVQEFNTNDNRFINGIIQLPEAPQKETKYDYGISAFSNIRSRGIQFGTRWAAVPIEEGGLYATGSGNDGYIPLGCTYEENALMLAEAYINLNQIEKGLSYVDEVRDFQNSGLTKLVGTNLNLQDAKEALRKERRIALFLKGTAFYDARRLGISTPISKGGFGRKNAIVYVPKSYINAAKDAALPCTIDYSYMDYWDVPANELDFNPAGVGSVTILANPK